MHRELVVLAFEKAKVEMEKSGISNPATTALAGYLVDKIEENEHFIYGERSLRNYYKSSIEKEDTIHIPQIEVINGLCKFLGYSDYYDFILKEKRVKEMDQSKKKDSDMAKKSRAFISRNSKIFLLGGMLVLISILYMSGITSSDQKWMIWEGNRYVESPFNKASYAEGSLKILDESILVNFRLVAPNCSTDFFNPIGNPKIWYGKNRKKEYEFFTSFGYHPETGNPLKAITDYMIKKYICNDSKFELQ